jgi:hypothetical protein
MKVQNILKVKRTFIYITVSLVSIVWNVLTFNYPVGQLEQVLIAWKSHHISAIILLVIGINAIRWVRFALKRTT